MITLVVDRSGSMESIFNATIEGLNGFLIQQRELPDCETMKVSLYTFDDMIETPIKNVPLRDCAIDPGLLKPRGTTALFDAIGLVFQQSSMEPQIVVIVTDGNENSSRDFSKREILDKITERRKLGWTFIFLAANQDAIASGASLGIPRENACTFGANNLNVGGVFKALSDSVKRVRSNEPAEFTPLERASSSQSSPPRPSANEPLAHQRENLKDLCKGGWDAYVPEDYIWRGNKASDYAPDFGTSTIEHAPDVVVEIKPLNLEVKEVCEIEPLNLEVKEVCEIEPLEWTCKVCTYCNFTEKTRCAVCEVARVSVTDIV